MKRVIVTGGNGFVGLNTITRLCKEDYEVHVLCKRPTSIFSDHSLPNVTVHEADVRNQQQIIEIFTNVSPTHVVHAAAVLTSSNDVEMVETNILGTENLLIASEKVGVQAFINIGSYLEYGPSTSMYYENSHCKPIGIYSISKLAQTLLGTSFAQTNRVPTINFRLFTPYGPHLRKGSLISNLILKSLAGEDVALTDKSVTRDFIYIDDVVDLFVEALLNPKKHAGEIYNVASGTQLSLAEIVSEIQQQIQTKSNFKWGAQNVVPYDSVECIASMEKVFAHFLWRPKTTFRDGLHKTIEHISRLY